MQQKSHKNREKISFKNRYKINKHHNSSSLDFNFKNRCRQNKNEKHKRKRKFSYKLFFNSEENIRIVFKKQKQIFTIDKKVFFNSHEIF